jgi:hypothetical protein
VLSHSCFESYSVRICLASDRPCPYLAVITAVFREQSNAYTAGVTSRKASSRRDVEALAVP